MVIISVIHYTLMHICLIHMSNPMLIQSSPIFLFLHSGRMWLDQTVHEKLEKKENRWLSNVFLYSVKIQRKWEIDWDATKAL